MLCDRYNHYFSYGVVVYLGVARNKRSLSSLRYKGVANVCFQKARKGYTLRYNPDTKWSRAMYKLLNQLQIDGQHMFLLNRDDHAGFRLDTTYTHKNFAALTKEKTVTTRTDFIGKRQPHLQTTSYNFSKTETTSEVCIGVVKASTVHEKILLNIVLTYKCLRKWTIFHLFLKT